MAFVEGIIITPLPPSTFLGHPPSVLGNIELGAGEKEGERETEITGTGCLLAISVAQAQAKSLGVDHSYLRRRLNSFCRKNLMKTLVH